MSEFEYSTQGGPIDLSVRPDLLTWATTGSRSVFLMQRSRATGVVSVGQSDFVVLNDRVTAGAAAEAADYVVCCTVLSSDLPIVTHWDAMQNPSPIGCEGTQVFGHRGGFLTGGDDGISTVSLDLDTTSSKYGEPVFQGSAIVNQDPCHNRPGSPDQPQAEDVYIFRTHELALFSDGTETTGAKDGEVADADLPGFERYIAETYSVYGISDLVAVWFSDRVRGLGGYPVLHRNAGTTLPSLRQALPAYQLVHAYIVDIGDLYPHIAGKENSIATFILPPGWTSTPVEDYPVLFNGHYDLHAATFDGVGIKLITAFEELLQSGDLALGVVWNGGGAAACQTMHRSAYDNAAKLLKKTAEHLAGDAQRVVMTGGSRGGTTALEMAANPYYTTTDYHVRYLIVENPQVRQGESLGVYLNPTHYIIQSTAQGFAGYKDCLAPDWVDPDSMQTLAMRAADVAMGEPDLAQVDLVWANDSAFLAENLKQRVYGLILRSGTHDTSKPFLHATRYVEHLRTPASAGAPVVPVRHEIAYRSGHLAFPASDPDEADLLKDLIENPPGTPGAGGFILDGEVFLRPDVNDAEVWIEFQPPHPPFMLEMPLSAHHDQYFTATAAGPPQAQYQVLLARFDTSFSTILESVLLPIRQLGDAQTVGHDVFDDALIPEIDEAGVWLYSVRYRLDSSSAWSRWFDARDIAPDLEDFPGVLYAPFVAHENEGVFLAPPTAVTGGYSGDLVSAPGVN